MAFETFFCFSERVVGSEGVDFSRLILLLDCPICSINAHGIRKFVTGLPSYHLVTGKLAYSSCISMNAENKENTALFDRHLKHRVGSFFTTVKTVICQEFFFWICLAYILGAPRWQS
jgi:hypothetical protein